MHVMIMSGLLEPLDMKYIPNFEHVDAPFRNPGYDNTDENGGLKYSVPYFSGATGYCQRTDKIATPQTSWATLWDTQYKGQINMLDDERDVLGAALKLLGYSVNTRSQAELDEATQKLIEQKPLVSAYDSTNIKHAVVGGQPLVMCWDGDALQAIDAMGRDAQAKKLVRFVHPIEGYSTWTDALVVPVGNNSRYGAHLWMDYLLEPGDGEEHELRVVPGAIDGLSRVYRPVRTDRRPPPKRRPSAAKGSTTSARLSRCTTTPGAR